MPMLRSALLLGVVLGGSAVAAPRYARPSSVQVTVALSDRVKPIPVVVTAPTPSLSPAEARAALGITIGPALAPAALQKLQASLGDAPQPAQLFELAMEFTKRSIEDRASGDPKAALAAKDNLLRAVKTWKVLTDNDAFRTFDRMDIALFHYGFLLQDARYMKEARAVYDKLLKTYPSSPYVPLAHLAFAEYFLEQNQLADAEARYRMVLKFPRSNAFALAMYRMGWVHLGLQRYQEALETMFQVATTSADPAIARAARRDFVVAYAGIAKPDKAFVAFQRVAGEAAPELYEQLATTYVARGELDKAAWVYRDLATRTPTSAQACAWQYQAAHLALSAPGVVGDDKARDIEQLAKLAAGAKLPAAQLAECRANALAMTTEMGRAWHHEASLTRNPASLGLAIRLYRAALSIAPDAETSFLLADAAWLRAEADPSAWRTAADAFLDVARDTATPADRARAAALTAVLALENALDLEPDLRVLAGAVELAKRTRPAPARTLQPLEASLVAAVEVYATVVREPHDVELGRMRFVEAVLRRKANDHAGAVPVLVDFVHWQRDSDLAELAAQMLLDSLVAQGKTDEARQMADRFAADTDFVTDKPVLQRAIDFVRSRSRRR